MDFVEESITALTQYLYSVIWGQFWYIYQALAALRQVFVLMNSKQKFILIIASIIVVVLFIALLEREARQSPESGWQTPAGSPRKSTPTATVSFATPPALEPGRTSPSEPTIPSDQAHTARPTAGPTALPGRLTPETTANPYQEFYVAFDGVKEGDGSIDEPWPLQYALNHPSRVRPGDTIWVRGGVYQGKFVSHLEGEEGKAITLRAYPGERVTLTNSDLVLDIATSHYVHFWGLEITASENSRDPFTRPETAYGIRINQGASSHHIKFINMIIHDMPAQGMAWWRANTDSEVYGSLVYFNGVNQFDHGIYANNDAGQKRIVDNFIFDNASHGIHAYGSSEQALNNFFLEGNTVFNNGSIGYSTAARTYGTYKRNILVGGHLIAEAPEILNNYTYYPGDSGAALNLGYRAGSRNAVVEDNYFAGGRIELGGENENLVMAANTVVGAGLASLFGLPFSGNELLLNRTAESRLFVRPNQYEPGRANITIYNWAKQDTIRITVEDLRGVELKKGDRYELHNVQDFYGDVIEGIYDGEGIDIPMTGRQVAQPLGLSFKPASTFPEFGAFVLMLAAVQP